MTDKEFELDFENATGVDVMLTLGEFLAQNRDLDGLSFSLLDENDIKYEFFLSLNHSPELKLSVDNTK